MSQFIDFDKERKVFYDNLYLEDYKLVVKFPLALDSEEVEVKLKKAKKKVKLDRFDLTKYTYLISHE